VELEEHPQPVPTAGLHGLRTDRPLRLVRGDLVAHGEESPWLTEHDLDPRRGSILVRSGKSGRRREVGMEDWGWEQLRPWLAARTALRSGRCSA
jgi:hypothetical protein